MDDIGLHFGSVSQTKVVRSLDDLDLDPDDPFSTTFARRQSLRSSRKSLNSLSSAKSDEILVKVGEIQHVDPFKKFKASDGSTVAVRKTTKVTTLRREKSSTSLNTDDDSSSSSSSDDEDLQDVLADFGLEAKVDDDHLSMQETLQNITKESEETQNGYIEEYLTRRKSLTKSEKEQVQAQTSGRSEDHLFSFMTITKDVTTETHHDLNDTSRDNRFSFASSVDTVREVELQGSKIADESLGKISESQEGDGASQPSTPGSKRRISSVNNPEYYKMAWGEIRKETHETEEDDEGRYWRVLQDRGLMSTDNNYRDYMPEDAYNQQNQSVTTVTKVSTQEIHQGNHRQPNSPNTSQSYINYSYQDLDNRPWQASPRSPANSNRDAPPTPTRLHPPNNNSLDSFDQQQSYRQEYQDYRFQDSQLERPSSAQPNSNPPYQNGPYSGYNGNQSPRPDDSFQGQDGPYNRDYNDLVTTQTTTTVTEYQQPNPVDDRLSDYTPSDQGRRDQYGNRLDQFDERTYSATRINEMNTYPKAPSDRPMDSPRSDMGPYGRGPPFLRPGMDDQGSQSPVGSMDRGGPFGSQLRMDAPPLVGGPIDPDMNRRSPSINSATRGFDIRWRNPDLPEVIEYLSHHNDMVKANAAAYLQHLCYMDDDIKAKTRGLGGIPVLVELVNSDIPEVHKASCGALKNLSYGRANDENKKAIKNAGGIPALVRLLRKTPDNDVRELVTGILWNLSSSKDLKRPIIDDGLKELVQSVIVPHSGWDPSHPIAESKPARDVYWSTVFRNASGVLRNISSDGDYARTKLRECEGLVDAIVYIVQAAIGKSDIDNKSVENCVCVLRNLSYACQEIQDRDYIRKRQELKQAQARGDTTGCFGGNKKKKDGKDKKNVQGSQNPKYINPTDPPRGMHLLWHPKIVPIYLPLLYDCTNPETLEAAAGAIQNLAACEWQPSEDIRETVRKQKGLPVLVELLNLEADRVVCAAATALRNLAFDSQSKDLIGKYAMRQLVSRLPTESRTAQTPNSDETVCALEALIYEVIKSSTEFATSLLTEGGVDRLMYMVKDDRFAYKVRKYASSILTKMWECKELHGRYREKNWKEVNFLVKPIDPRKGSPSKSLPSSADNTLNRPRMDQSGPTVPGYNENTLPYINRQPVNNTMARETMANNSYSRMPDRDPNQFDAIPMTQLPPQQPQGYYPNGPAPDSPRGGYYAAGDIRRQDDLDRHSDMYQPNDYQPGEYAPNHSYGDLNPPHDDIDRHSDYRGDYNARMNDLDLSRQPDNWPEGGGHSPRNYRPEGDYTPQGSDYSRREDYIRQGSYQEQYPSDPTRREDYRPPGGVALFSNLGPAPDRQTPQPQDDSREPLYARVVKQGGRGEPGIMLDNGPPSGGPGGADSWV